MANPTQTQAPKRNGLLRCPSCENLMNGTETTANSQHNMVRYTCNCGVCGPWAFSDKGYNYEKAKQLAAAMQPAPIESDETGWQWLVGKEFSLGAVDEVSGETATVTRGDDTYRIRIAELLEEDVNARHRPSKMSSASLACD